MAALAGLFLVAAIFYIVLPILWGLFGVAVTLFVTFIVSLLINPVVDRYEQRRVPRVATIMGIYVLVVVVALVLTVLIVRPLTADLDQLAAHSSEEVAKVVVGLQQVFGPGVTLATIGLHQQAVADGLSQSSGALRNGLASLSDVLINVMLVGVLTLYLVSDLSVGRAMLRTLVPESRREQVRHTLGTVSIGLSRWLIAQLGISLYYAVCYTIVNIWLGIPYAVTIGIVSGLLEFIPYLGGIVGLIMTLMAALTVSPQTAVWAFILGAVVGLIGGNFVGPVLLGKATQIHPVFVIIALLIGGVGSGALGVLLAMPVTVIIVILLQEWRQSGRAERARAAGQAAVAAGQAAVAALMEGPEDEDAPRQP
jgi:predicted PurR-regulated permease PerM